MNSILLIAAAVIIAQIARAVISAAVSLWFNPWCEGYGSRSKDFLRRVFMVY